jgi:hypothetical protein
MNTIERKGPLDIEARVRALLSECEKIVDRHVQASSRPIFDLDEEEQEAVVDRVNAYIEFEFSQANIPPGTLIGIAGTGLLLVCDGSGNVLGAETISNGDLVYGEMTEMAALPVPTLACVMDSDDESIPGYDQVLSSIVLLGNATYKTGLMRDGSFEVEHDLSPYRIGIVMAHRLEVSVKAA